MTQRVNSNRIADNSITAPKLSGGGVSTDLIANNAVTVDKIATDAVTSIKIATGAVTSTKVASGLLIPSGTVMLFVQTSAPTGWTKSIEHNDKALRVVSGTASSGGNTAFSSTFVNRTPAGSVSGTNSGGGVSDSGLTTGQLASHAHTEQLMSSSATMTTTGTRIGGSASGATNRTATSPTLGAGSGEAHGHGFTQPSWSGTFTGTALDFGVRYVDTIIATKD
jgi:hypothetical protein